MVRRIVPVSRSLFATVLLLALVFAAVRVEGRDGSDFVYDVVYGQRGGESLSFDVIKPRSGANRSGILYLVSGGWQSQRASIEWYLWKFDKLLNKGFTILLVRHGNVPRQTVPDVYQDVRRAVRFVRLHAKDYGVDPERLGVYGGSSGGHLALLLGLAGDDGDKNAEGALGRVSSRVGAVVAFYPPVDLRMRTVPSTEYLALGSPKTLFFGTGTAGNRAVARYPALDFSPALAAAVSPILFASADDPPTLLVHGDADTLVDLNNSRMLYAALRKLGVATELVVIEGGQHGFWNSVHNELATRAMTAWFEKYLTRGSNASTAEDGSAGGR